MKTLNDLTRKYAPQAFGLTKDDRERLVDCFILGYISARFSEEEILELDAALGRHFKTRCPGCGDKMPDDADFELDGKLYCKECAKFLSRF